MRCKKGIKLASIHRDDQETFVIFAHNRKTGRMMKGIFTLLFCLSAYVGFAQVPITPGTDDGEFVSFQTGTWNNVSSWSRWDGNTSQWVYPAPNTPTSADETVLIQSPHLISVSASVTADQITVSSGATLRVTGAAVLTINDVAGDQLVINGTLVVDANATVTKGLLSSCIIQVNGTVNNTGTISNTSSGRMFFNTGSAYNHLYPAARIPMAKWDASSTCTIRTNVDEIPVNIAQTFGSFIWNTPSLGQDLTFNGNLPAVQVSLNIQNTNGFTLFLTLSNPYTLNVPGSLAIGSGSKIALTYDQDAAINVSGNFTNAGVIVGSYGAGNVDLNVVGNVSLLGGTLDAGLSSGTTRLNITGNYINTGTALTKSQSPVTTPMSITFNKAGIQTFTSTLATNFPVNYSTTNTSNLTIAATSFLSGSGTLTVGSTSLLTLLSTSNTGALQANTTGGNVRVSGIRTYNGTLVYGASARQYMAVSHPGNANTRINNAAGVTMLGSVAFTTGVLTLTKGVLRIENSSTLTVASVINSGGSLGIDPNSSLVINGSGTYGNLALTHITGTAMNNLTINRNAGSVTQVTPALGINGTLTLSQGTFGLSTNTVTTVNGPFVVSSGVITAVSTAQLAITGSGGMPTGVSISGALNALTMNRVGNLNLTNTSSSFLTLTRLNLYGGSVTNAGGLRMANNSTIARTDGSLTNAIVAAGVYNVQYLNFSAADLPIGLEIPATGSALSSFTINNTNGGTHNVSLNRALDVGSDVIVTNGGLITSNNTIFIGRNFTIAAAGKFFPGSSTLRFDGSVAQAFGGPTAYTINNLVIAKSVRSNFTLNSPVNIQTIFAVTTHRSDVNVGNNLLTLLSTATTTAYIPTLFSDASGTSTITGRVIVQRQLPNANGSRAYRYITPTVTNSFVSDWQAEFPISGTFSNPSTGTFGGVKIIPANPSLFYYDESLVTGGNSINSGYVAYPSSGNSSAAPLVSGRGYAAYVRTPGVLTFDTRGTIAQNNIVVNCTQSGGTNGGFNLVGNPYPAPIDWNLVSPLRTGGVGSAIYLTDNTNNAGAGTGATVSYVPGVGGTGTFNGIIASGQAFFVHATSAGTLRIRENQKFSGQTGFIRETTPENVLKIKMKTGAVEDNILVHISDSATFDFDQKYDAYKYDPFGVNISTLSSSNERLSINSIGRECNAVVPFDIDEAVVGSYTLDFSGLETFTAQVAPVLYDKVLDKRIDISSTPHYAFTVSDAATLRNRFQLLLDVPVVQTGLALTGDAVCEGNTVGYISLESSQTDVKYTALLDGVIVSTDVVGTGTSMQIPVQMSELSEGDNELTISAQRMTCDARILDRKAIVTIVKKASISNTKQGSVCGSGSTSISVTGANAVTFNWYEDISDLTPVADQHGSDFITPVLSKSKTYYVAAVNSRGCEGERTAVMAIVTSITPALINTQGATLSSNYAKGNQWYLNGQPISGATGQTIEAVSSGTYSVIVSSENCSTTSEGREMLITELEETSNAAVNLFPNPTTDKVIVEVRAKDEVQATLITQTGVLLNSMKLSGTQDIKSGEFSLGSQPDGVYFIRITEGNKVYTKKISKIK